MTAPKSAIGYARHCTGCDGLVYVPLPQGLGPQPEDFDPNADPFDFNAIDVRHHRIVRRRGPDPSEPGCVWIAIFIIAGVNVLFVGAMIVMSMAY